jgi:hypothetical protein
MVSTGEPGYSVSRPEDAVSRAAPRHGDQIGNPPEPSRPDVSCERQEWGMGRHSDRSKRTAAYGREPPSKPGTKRVICTTNKSDPDRAVLVEEPVDSARQCGPRRFWVSRALCRR